MDEQERKKDNVYGENHPASDDQSRPGIRDRVTKHEGTGETLDRVREDDAATGQNSGGMGREHTPRDGDTEGAWEHRDEEIKKSGSNAEPDR